MTVACSHKDHRVSSQLESNNGVHIIDDHLGCEASEFITTLTTISDLTTDEVTDLVRELDEDGNGKISKEEFKTLLVKHAEFVDAEFL